MSDKSKGQLFWNRTGWVDISGYGKPPVGLDFKFEVKKYGNIYSKFSVGILGLNSSNINAMTVYNPVDAVNQGREIRVFAGYEADGVPSMICKGTVMNAVPTPPPEMWMNFECMPFLRNKIPIDDVEPMYNKPISEVAQKICDMMGFKYFWRSLNVKESTKINFNFTGCRDTALTRLADGLNLVVILGDNNDVYFYDKKAWNTIPIPRPIDIPIINIESGLLMVGNINAYGAKIRVRLNDTYSLFSWIKLESKLIPRASGYYFVLSKTHKGHLRGEEWYTELELIRKG